MLKHGFGPLEPVFFNAGLPVDILHGESTKANDKFEQVALICPEHNAHAHAFRLNCDKFPLPAPSPIFPLAVGLSPKLQTVINGSRMAP